MRQSDNQSSNLYIGLMSGTSMDGVDAALVDVDQNQCLASLTMPYDAALKSELLNFNPQDKVELSALLALNQKIGYAFSEAVKCLLKKSGYTTKNIHAIGSHGQTLVHAPNTEMPFTLQLGCPHIIAAQNQMTVVADFRSRDIVLGGQGAPLAPYYHHILFNNKKDNLAVVNIGGIANVTILAPGLPPVGYDTGPGNALLDFWVNLHQGYTYDEAGDWAKTGGLIPELLDQLLSDEYFKQKPPKSIDKAYFLDGWLQKHLKPDYKPEDVQTTLVHLTAHSIANTIKAPCSKLLVCGGGVKNAYLLNILSHYLPGIQVQTTDAYGVDSNYLEAMMIAWFAHQALKNHPLDFTKITGAHTTTLMGTIYPYAT